MGTFEVKKSGDGLMFNLKAGNGEVIGTSEVYNSRASLENGIASVKKNAPARFRLKARNGEIILASQGYASSQGCLAGVESVKKSAAEANIAEIA